MTNPFSEPPPSSPAEAPVAEQTVWQGGPSQMVNLPLYLVCACGAGAVVGGAFLLVEHLGPLGWVLAGAAWVPLGIALARWIDTHCQRFELTTERLRVSRGLWTRRTDEVELYRVKDHALLEPLGLRLFGLGHLVITTTDDANSTVILRAVPEVRALRDLLRQHVERRREEKRVRITEFES